MNRRNRQAHTEIIRYDANGEHLFLRTVRLVVFPESGESFTFQLPEKAIRIGSDPDCDLVLNDRFVSAFHASLTPENGRFILEDLGSTNGTQVGEAGIDRASLEPDGEFVVGSTTIRLEAKEARTDLPELIPANRCGIIGESFKIKKALSVLYRVAPSELPVMIMGQTGTGKELAARFLHVHSRRKDGPFLAINCSAVSGELFESELFGHERGAFTSATATRIGLLEMAAGGTVFFDEIGEMPLNLQPKLLRVLEQKTLRRVGGNREIATDVRIVAATNRDLAQQVQAGVFRKDLFYRLSVVPLVLPQLVERDDDILKLAEYFLKQEASRRELDKPYILSARARAKLTAYRWPGNVRELRNTLCAACQLARKPPAIGPYDLRFLPLTDEITASDKTLDEVEAETIRATLKRYNGNTKKVADVLGLPLSTLYDRLKKHEIVAGRYKETR